MASGFLVSQFSAENGLGSRLIRYLTEGQVSHVDIVVPKEIVLIALAKGWFKSNPGDEVFYNYYSYWLLGARTDGGVQLRPPNYAKFTLTTMLGATVPDIDAGYEYAFAQIGKPYNKGAIWDFIIHKTRAFDFDQKSWFCDCLDYAVYWKAGLKLLNSENPLGLTPQQVELSPDFSIEKMMMSMNVLPKGALSV